jgi:hypothetical protein
MTQLSSEFLNESRKRKEKEKGERRKNHFSLPPTLPLGTVRHVTHIRWQMHIDSQFFTAFSFVLLKHTANDDSSIIHSLHEGYMQRKEGVGGKRREELWVR